MGNPIAKETAAQCGGGIHQNQVLALVDPTGVAPKLIEKYAEALLRAFPKTTQPGDKHSYAQFASNPPAGMKGTIHIAQYNPFIEPTFGLDWFAVEAVVNELLRGGEVHDRFKVTAVPVGVLALGPTVFGWAADGEGATATKLFALACVAMLITREPSRPPASLQTWLRQLSIVSVAYRRHASMHSKVATNWADHVVAHAISGRLTPILMAKSLCNEGVHSPAQVDAVCRQFLALPAASVAKLQGFKLNIRMKALVDRARLPNASWNFLVRHYAESKGVVSAVAYSDGVYDFLGTYVGEAALQDTFNPFLRKITTVTAKSQLMVLESAEYWHRRSGKRLDRESTGGNSWALLCAVHALNCNILDALLQVRPYPADVIEAFYKDGESDFQKTMKKFRK